MGELSILFKALSEPLRIRIVRLLLDNGREAYGEELANALGIPAYRLSRHLKVLRTTGLINERREGRWVYYSLAKRNGQLLRALRRIIADAVVSAPDGGSARSATPSGRRKNQAVRRSPRKPRTLVDEEGFNWNEGPAIPGIL